MEALWLMPFFAAVATMIVGVNVWAARHSHEWHSTLLLPWQRVTFVDGSQSNRGADILRRRVNGAWQYRAATGAEIAGRIVDDVV